MGVNFPAPDLVATRFGEVGLAKATQKRPYHEDRSAQGGATLHEIVAHHIFAVDFVGCESVFSAVVPLYFHPHSLKYSDKVSDVAYFRNIRYGHGTCCEERGTDHLQRFVFCSLRYDFAAKSAASLDYK